MWLDYYYYCRTSQKMSTGWNTSSQFIWPQHTVLWVTKVIIVTKLVIIVHKSHFNQNQSVNKFISPQMEGWTEKTKVIVTFLISFANMPKNV